MQCSLRKTVSSLVLVCIGAELHAQDVLPSDKGQRELVVRGPVYTPIRHQAYFRGERELFGYNPRFRPGPVTFDPDNRPYIRDGDVVQTLDENGRWVGLDFAGAIRATYPVWDGVLRKGPGMEMRVVFDDAGDAYMIVNARTSNLKQGFLLHSTDRCRTWTVYPLTLVKGAVFEHQDGHNQIIGPPIIAQAKGRSMRIQIPRKRADGTLEVGQPVTVSEGECWLAPYHSGGSNVVFTRDGKSHIVWLDVSAPSGRETMADAYIATYDHATRAVSERVLLGHTQPDNHNGPVISADSRGFLHVLIGAHHFPFQHTTSLKFNSSQGGWTPPKAVGERKRKIGEGSYTYTAFNCTSDDTLHLATRWAGLDYAFHIAYLRRPADGEWSGNTDLLVPFKNRYSVWYHKFNMDRQGRIFMNYWYYPAGLPHEAALAYKAKWPDEEAFVIPADADDQPNGLRLRTTWHDPCILLTDDVGKSWRLAMTEDFVDCITCPVRSSEGEPAEIANSVGMMMRLIQPGDFVMGDDAGHFDEKPAHRVRISTPFYMGTHEVTLGQFKQFVAESGYKTLQERTRIETWYAWLGRVGKDEGNATWRRPNFDQTDDHPVTNLMRIDALAFCDWLSKQEGRTYRLPTEAEWEYACRAGTTTPWSFGSDEKLAGAYAWFSSNSAATTHPVGAKRPNPWGLYDMHGNVAEWVSDAYGLYPNATRTDPRGPAPIPNEPKAVIRGGSWADDAHGPNTAWNLRSSSRYYIYFPRIKVNWVGFRVVMGMDSASH